MTTNTTPVMTPEELSHRSASLAALSKAYYEGNPLMSDAEFDALLEEYKTAGGEEITGHGYKVEDPSRKVEHATQMGSLDKEKTMEGLRSWIAKCHKFWSENCDTTTPLIFSASPKFDGLAVAVTVKDGQVVQVATRGNGFVGEDVTATALNAPTIAALASRPDGVYAGEIMLPKELLATANELKYEAALAELSEKHREKMTEKDHEKLREKVEVKEVRNAASGILRSLNDTHKVARVLVFADHNTGEWVQLHEHDALTEEKLQEILDFFDAQRINYPVAEGQHVNIDGVVFKVENADVRDGMGHGQSCPRWAIAYKYKDAIYQSVVTGVVWEAPGKVGRITPVIEYETIYIPGGKYVRATSHNLSQFNAHAPAVGDDVFIIKSGDVIPYVVKVEHKGGERLTPPTECPTCGKPTAVDGTYLVCTAPRTECDPVNALVLIITALGIKGIQEKVIRKVYDAHLTATGDSFDALYMLKELPKGKIAEIETISRRADETEPSGYKTIRGKMGKSIDDKIHKVLDDAWTTTALEGWIYGLNVPRVGHTVSKDIERTYGSIDALLDAIDNPAKVKTTRNLGGVNWESIVAHRERFVNLRDWMTNHGVVPVVATETVVEDTFWGGKKVAITGSLPIKRAEVQAWLEGRGATVQSSFSSSTDVLIDAGDGTSTKSVKARKAGKDVLDGETFMNEHYTA